MSVSAGIAAGAAAQSAAATAAAAAAKKTACMSFVKGFQNDTATTAEMRQYADCVSTLYPNPLSDGSVWILKAAILIVFAGFIGGGIRGHFDSYGDWTDRYLWSPFLYGSFAFLGVLCLGLLGAAAAFLIQA